MLVQSWKKLFVQGLAEDNVGFDWTARSLQSTQDPKRLAQATLVCKSSGVWCGAEALRALEVLSLEYGAPIETKLHFKDGERLEPKTKIATLHGSSESIVTFERTLINLVSYSSGIATQTRALVEKARSKNLKNPPRITATRKTLPGYKEIAIESTLVGGAHPHRFNLSGGVLLKENHIAAHGGVAKAIQAARAVSPHLLKVEIEVRSLHELKEAIQSGAEVIMLDNFSKTDVQSAIAMKPQGVIFEVSGGIHEGNIEEYLIEGIDVISVGSVTHSVKSLDFSLLMNSLL